MLLRHAPRTAERYRNNANTIELLWLGVCLLLARAVMLDEQWLTLQIVLLVLRIAVTVLALVDGIAPALRCSLRVCVAWFLHWRRKNYRWSEVTRYSRSTTFRQPTPGVCLCSCLHWIDLPRTGEVLYKALRNSLLAAIVHLFFWLAADEDTLWLTLLDIKLGRFLGRFLPIWICESCTETVRVW